MGVLEFEGWDRETSTALSGWRTNGSGGSITADAAGAFAYGRAFNAASSGNSFGRNATFGPVTECWTNFHFFYTTVPASTGAFYRLRQGGNSQCGLGMDNAGRIVVLRGDSTTVHTFAGVLPANAWLFIQVRFLASSTVGECEVWINGKLHGTATGLNIQSQATADMDGWQVSTSVGGMQFDNVLIYSLAGAVPNARTPETRLYAALPTGPGSSAAWTRNGGSANWDRVNEQPSNGDTTYNSAASAPLDDLYALPSDIPAGSVVYAVAAELVARKDDAGTNEIDALIRSGGTTYAGGAPVALSTTYQRFRQMWATDPATGVAWTIANANASQIGIRRTT